MILIPPHDGGISYVEDFLKGFNTLSCNGSLRKVFEFHDKVVQQILLVTNLQ